MSATRRAGTESRVENAFGGAGELRRQVHTSCLLRDWERDKYNISVLVVKCNLVSGFGCSGLRANSNGRKTNTWDECSIESCRSGAKCINFVSTTSGGGRGRRGRRRVGRRW